MENSHPPFERGVSSPLAHGHHDVSNASSPTNPSTRASTIPVATTKATTAAPSPADGAATADPSHTHTPAGPVLDATAFPHILDNIVRLAPPASLAALRQVSRDVRARVRPRLFEHVVFLARDNTIHVLTGARPHLHLGSFGIKDMLPVPADVAALGPGDPFADTRVLDTYAVRPLWRLGGLRMPRLAVLRRVHAHRNRGRLTAHLPPAPTVVDYLHLTAHGGPAWPPPPLGDIEAGGAATALSTQMQAPHGTRHHVLHVAWDEWDRRVPFFSVRGLGGSEGCTLVLRPYGRGGGPAHHFSLLRELVGGGLAGTVVGAERMHPARGPDAYSGVGGVAAATPPSIVYRTYEEWAGSFAGARAEPAPETLEAYYESAQMRAVRAMVEADMDARGACDIS